MARSSDAISELPTPKALHKVSNFMVVGDGIEPSKRGLSRHNRETHVFQLKQLLTALVFNF